jgi:hypothetical protein
LVRSLHHFLQSEFIHYGGMTGSYYEHHYRYERLSLPQWKREKSLLEIHAMYEAAFISGFKALECFFDVNKFKKNDIINVMKRMSLENIPSSKNYRRLFQIFDGKEEWIAYKDILEEFLKIRNAVAAHANQTPPEKLQITADTVCEIQHFYKSLFLDVLNTT